MNKRVLIPTACAVFAAIGYVGLKADKAADARQATKNLVQTAPEKSVTALASWLYFTIKAHDAGSNEDARNTAISNAQAIRYTDQRADTAITAIISATDNMSNDKSRTFCSDLYKTIWTDYQGARTILTGKSPIYETSGITFDTIYENLKNNKPL